MWSVIVLLGVLGYVLKALLPVAERHLLAWHWGARRRRGGIVTSETPAAADRRRAEVGRLIRSRRTVGVP